MANSKVTYTADGTTQSFAVTFPYISRSHVSVTVGGATATFTWNNDNLITITTPTVSSDDKVVISRSTSINTRLTDYVDGSNLTETDLDLDSKQAFYMAQEALDERDSHLALDVSGADSWDALSKKITDLTTPTNANDASNKSYVDAQIDTSTTNADNAAASATAAATSATNAAASETNTANITGAIAWKYTFDSSTTMGDPAAGNVRLDHATLGSVTNIAFDAQTAESNDISDLIASIDDGTNNSHEGFITIRKSGAPSTFAVYAVTGGVTDNTSWLQVPVTHVASGGTFSNADTLYIGMTRSGNLGATGPQGIQGIQGPTGATGTAATIAVGSVSTSDVAAGGTATASVTNSGTSSAATFDFTFGVVTGDTGATGATGPQGPAGDVDDVLTTQGDILYRGASTSARLGAGTSGYFLKTQGTGADPVWAEVTGGGPSLGTDSVIRTNAKTISENITFAGTENGSSVGPISVASGYTVTVTSGSTWTII